MDNTRRKVAQTIMLTYDRIEEVEVDLGIDALRGLYASGCMNEQFVRWVPERFAMQVMFHPGNTESQKTAIGICIIALYRTIPKSKVTNLQIWLNGHKVTQLETA